MLWWMNPSPYTSKGWLPVKKMFGLMLTMLVGVALLVPLAGCPGETKKTPPPTTDKDKKDTADKKDKT
jgi:hypothetical protein